MREYCLLGNVLYKKGGNKKLDSNYHDEFYAFLSNFMGLKNYACRRPFSLKGNDWKAVGCFPEVRVQVKFSSGGVQVKFSPGGVQVKFCPAGV